MKTIEEPCFIGLSAKQPRRTFLGKKTHCSHAYRCNLFFRNCFDNSFKSRPHCSYTTLLAMRNSKTASMAARRVFTSLISSPSTVIHTALPKSAPHCLRNQCRTQSIQRKSSTSALTYKALHRHRPPPLPTPSCKLVICSPSDPNNRLTQIPKQSTPVCNH